MVLYVCPTEIETKRGAAERQHYRLEQEGHSVCTQHTHYVTFTKPNHHDYCVCPWQQGTAQFPFVIV